MKKIAADSTKHRIIYRVILALAVLIELHSLRVIYRDFVYVLLRYVGFQYNPAPIHFIMISWLIALIPILWLPIKITRPSMWIYITQYALVFIPLCSVPMYSGVTEPERLLVFMAAVLTAFGSMALIYRLPLIQIPASVKIQPKMFWVIIFALMFIMNFLVIQQYGLKFKFIAFEEVYDVRLAYRAQMEDSNIMVAYAIGWLSNVVNIFFMACGILLGSRMLFAIGFIGQFLIYSITAFKVVMATFFLMLFVWLMVKKYPRYCVMAFFMLIVFLCQFSIIQYKNSGSIFSIGLVTRTILTPGYISGLYFDYFSVHPPGMLGDSILSPIVSYPYHLPLAKVIGKEYYHNEQTNANGNTWAYAFGNFRYVGIVLFGLLFAAVLWLYDSLARRHHILFGVLLLAGHTLALANGNILSGLRSHGWWLTFLMIYFLPFKRVTFRIFKTDQALRDEYHATYYGKYYK